MLDIKQFLTTYLECSSTQECADKLGVSKFTVERYARELRKKGVKVPYMRPNGGGVKRGEINVEELNKLIEEKKGA